MVWNGDQVKGEKIFSLKQKSPSHVIGFPSFLPHTFLVFYIQAVWEVDVFHSQIFFPTERLYCGSLGCGFWKTMLTLKCHTCGGKEPQLCRDKVGPEGAVLHSLWKFQANSLPWQCPDAHLALWPNCHSVRWEMFVGLHVGSYHPHTLTIGQWATWAMFWSYVHTDVKDDWSDGWYILTKNIISIYILIATTLTSLLC